MRMWNVDPKLLCQKHLCGEHNETHSFIGSIKKGISMKGYIEKGLLEIHTLEKRHEELAREMINRGYNHKSPFPNDFKFDHKCGKIDSEKNIKILYEKCPECRIRINKEN